MLERLLELFFHAKSGVFAGIFLIGTTGALVTATVSNGVTTITITQASASPSASASASPSASTSASASPSHSPSASPSHSPSASPSSASAPQEGSGSATCRAQAHEAADAVHDVNSAFSALHTNLMHTRADARAAKAIVEKADKDLKEIRQSAVKAIHATNTCASGKDDEDNDKDEDNDENDDNDRSSHDNFVVVLISNIQSFFGSHTLTVNNTTTTNTTFTGGPKDIADQAVAAMQQVFDDANAQLSELASPSPRATRSPKPSAHVDTNHSGHGKSGHGDSGHGEREGGDD